MPDSSKSINRKILEADRGWPGERTYSLSIRRDKGRWEAAVSWPEEHGREFRIFEHPASAISWATAKFKREIAKEYPPKKR